MNFSLLDKILSSQGAILVTILRTKGHTYQKAGGRALFTPGSVTPLWGNLGALCIDQSILEAGERALTENRPLRVRIDTSDDADALIGTGTACGGEMDLLIEPVRESHQDVYRQLRETIARGTPVTLSHNLTTGELSLTQSGTADTHFTESIPAPPQLFFFGATPLARTLLGIVADMDFSLHLVDWRPALLDGFRDVARLTFHQNFGPFDRKSFVLVLSHSFERDLGVIEAALRARCRYVGLLSSTTRREQMYDALEGKGATREQLDQIHSPVGLDIGARTDAEIAVSIVAQLIEVTR